MYAIVASASVIAWIGVNLLLLRTFFTRKKEFLMMRCQTKESEALRRQMVGLKWLIMSLFTWIWGLLTGCFWALLRPLD